MPDGFASPCSFAADCQPLGRLLSRCSSPFLFDTYVPISFVSTARSLFRSFVGSHISAFNFCKSQSRERVSPSMFQPPRTMVGSALTRALTKECSQLAFGCARAALAADLDKFLASSKPSRLLLPDAGQRLQRLSDGSFCA